MWQSIVIFFCSSEIAWQVYSYYSLFYGFLRKKTVHLRTALQSITLLSHYKQSSGKHDAGKQNIVYRCMVYQQ